jgi:tetratricopeptide (TPR) repeat protein
MPSPHFREQLCLLFGKTAEELGFIPPVNGHEETIEAPPLWHVPLRRTPFFTGREVDLEQMHIALQASGTAALSQAISGLGGIGKTSLALEYAYRFRAHYQAILWVGADSREHLLAKLAELAGVLGLPEQHDTDQGRAVAAVQHWLQCYPNWLLIVDNLDDLGMGEEALPSGPGHLLVTTRAHATGFVTNRLDLAPLTLEEGALLLLRRAKLLPPNAPLSQVSPVTHGWAEIIATHLDGLPLALDQAGAYVEETSCGLDGYLRRLATHQKALLQRRGQMVAGHPASVSATLLLSMARVRVVAPEAAELLECCAFLHPDAIPEELLTQGASELGPRLASVGADSVALDAMLESLGHFSLLRRNPQTQMLRMHRLVQAVLKDHLTPEQQQIWAERVVRALHCTLPEVGLTPWIDFSRYFPQALRGNELIAVWNLQTREAGQLLAKTGAYLRQQGQYPEAERLLKRALFLQQRLLGRRHPETARTLYHLAELFRDRGQYRRAQTLFCGTLQIQKQTLEDEHLHIAHTLTSLASLHRDQWHYVQGEPLARRALQILEQTLDPIHPDIADSLNVLASLVEGLGQYKQARDLHQRALFITETVYGLVHPQVAASLNNLANVFFAQQDYAQAEGLYQRAHNIQEQILPPGHLDVVTTLCNLANNYERQGQYTVAEPLAYRTNMLIEQGFGSEHPVIAFSLDLRARVARGLGNVTEAESLGRRALHTCKQVLGSANPFTATIMRTLAQILQDQGQFTEAEALLKQALTSHEHTLGPDHSWVAEDLEQYARFLRQTQRESEATILETRAQVIRAQLAQETAPS